MFRRWLILLLAIVSIMAAALPAAAQTAPPFEPIGAPANPNAAITFPPPIYLLRGQVEIRGTVNVQNLIGHYLEFRALGDDFTASADARGWSPATLPNNQRIIDGVLGVWDTTAIPDGVYELRLTVIQSGSTITSRVSPVRVENAIRQGVVVVATPIPTAFVPPASPTPAGPVATAPDGINVNVRSGDSTLYPAFTVLRGGESLPIVGLSSTGTGWLVIQLPDGRQGYVAPSAVRVTGSTLGLPLFTPPPPPATPIPPTPTPPPAPTLPDGTITNVRFDRAIRQGEAFQVIITVFNTTGVPMGPVVVACNFRPQNAFFSAQLGGLGGFTQQDVALTARLDSGGGAPTTADCAIDVNNLIPEVNEGNNFFSLTTTLLAP
jgi:hypothetical protein